MKRTAMWLAAAVVAMAATRGGAAPFQSAQVSDTARWVVHADVAALKATQIGGFVWGKLNEGDAAAKLGAATAMLGFDPRKDVSTVTLYGKSKDPAQSVALVTGTFNQDHLVALLKGNDTYEALSYGTYPIHSWIDDKKPADGRQYGCFHGNRVLMSRGLDMLKEAIDVLDGKRAGLKDGQAFGAALPIQAPFFIAGADMADASALNPNAQVLRQAQSGQMAVAEQAGTLSLAIQLLSRDATAASNIQAVAQGAIAMAQLNAQQNPELSQLAQAVKITLDGTTVRLDFAYPSQTIITMVEDAMAKQAAHRQAVVPPPAQ
jgi:hypothetical protein